MPWSAPQDPATARVFNIPGVVIATALVLVLIHALKSFSGESYAIWAVAVFGFIPAQLTGSWQVSLPGAMVFSFVSYALLHASWAHLASNLLWLVVFGTLVARRLGGWRFLVHALIAAIAGAVATLPLNWGETAFIIGASAVVSGQLGSAVPLMFAEGRGATAMLSTNVRAVRALRPLEIFTHRGALIFLLIWLAITLISGATGVLDGSERVRIAWDAHLGGLIGGLIAFYWLDPGPVRS